MRLGMPQKTVGVLGATGYTGTLIVRELKRRRIPLLAAGRNHDKLQRLAAEVGDLDVIEVDVQDQASLERLAQRSHVIINTAGPFVEYGEPVVRTAIANGVHYLDTTGEQPFMKAMLVQDHRARERNVAVVSAYAFEVAVSDCAAAVAAEGFTEISTVHVTYATRFHSSQGTQRTVLRMLQSAGYAYSGGKWVEEAPARVVRYTDFPAPLGRVAAVSFPSAEIITIPRHLKLREVRVFMSVPAFAAGPLSVTAPYLRLLLHTPLLRLATVAIGSGTGGPDEKTRRRDEFRIAVDVRGVRGGAADHRQLLVHGRDPYGLTAVIAAYGAEQMCRDDYAASGVLPPATAFAPQAFLDYLKEFGLTYEVREGLKRSGARGSQEQAPEA
jgi:short subunit dehydrogenase-like uncharacterized protein